MKIEGIEGIGLAFGEKLRSFGILTAENLLQKAASAKDRKNLADKTGIDEKKILKWVNLCDLCRVKGVSTQYSELLEAAGVDTIKELRTRNVENLHAKLLEVNATKKLVRSPPNEKLVASWVTQAKTLDPIICH